MTPDALDALGGCVGPEHVLTDAALLAAVGTATYPTTATVPAVVRPGSTDEVRACVRVAAERGLALWPVSRGTNWGYGSRVPARTGTVVLDLSRMDRILGYDDRLGTVRVEPGVTFRQLSAFLRAHRSPWLACAIGGSGESSVLGNALDRGIGKGVLGDRAAHVCDLEVVLGTGELLRTGLGRFPGARAAGGHRWGSGPSLDGLFFQSNLGIVTALTVWLQRRPSHLSLYFHREDEPGALGAVVETLRDLCAQGVLRPTLTSWNDARVIAVTRDYPWARAGGVTPLPPALRAELRAELGCGAWGGDAAVGSPSAAHAAATRALVVPALEAVTDHVEVVEADADEMDAVLARDGEGPSDLRAALLSNYLGVPDRDAIRSVYWRKPAPPAGRLDPDADRCGLLWCAPVVPFRGDDVTRVTTFLADAMEEAGFEPGLTVQYLSERVAYVVASLAWDRDVAADERAAVETYHRLTGALTAMGYPPYRLATLSMGGSEGPAVVDALGRVLDPDGVIAPGRYRG